MKNDIRLYLFTVVIDFVNFKPNEITLITYNKKHLKDPKKWLQIYKDFVDAYWSEENEKVSRLEEKEEDLHFLKQRLIEIVRPGKQTVFNLKYHT